MTDPAGPSQNARKGPEAGAQPNAPEGPRSQGSGTPVVTPRVDPRPELYPDGVLEGSPGVSASGGATILLAVVVVVLIFLMVTGWNSQVPFLHPSTNSGVTVIGDRTTYSYLYVQNGTMLNATAGTLCSGCPLEVPPGATFTYALTLVNDGNHTIEIAGIAVAAPFSLLSYTPSGTFLIAPGLSEPAGLHLVAPSGAGTYAIPILISVDVQ